MAFVLARPTLLSQASSRPTRHPSRPRQKTRAKDATRALFRPRPALCSDPDPRSVPTPTRALFLSVMVRFASQDGPRAVELL